MSSMKTFTPFLTPGNVHRRPVVSAYAGDHLSPASNIPKTSFTCTLFSANWGRGPFYSAFKLYVQASIIIIII